jgi:hypothetical protein
MTHWGVADHLLWPLGVAKDLGVVETTPIWPLAGSATLNFLIFNFGLTLGLFWNLLKYMGTILEI